MASLVSVIMPAYNGAKFIEQAIESVVQQTYADWELVIVEDCSTDATRALLQRYDDARIWVLYNDTNQGIAYSTNKAIAHSHGRYLALLDDDDIAMPERLAIEARYLDEHPEIAVVGGKNITITAGRHHHIGDDAISLFDREAVLLREGADLVSGP